MKRQETRFPEVRNVLAAPLEGSAMRLRITIASGIALTGLMAISGCSNNGAFGLQTKDRKTVEAYQDFKKNQTRAAAQHEIRGTPVAFAAEWDTNQGAHAVAGHRPSWPGSPPSPSGSAAGLPPGVSLVAGSSSDLASGTARRNLLRLYGTTQQRYPGREGPLDGTDNIRQVTFATLGSDFDPEVDPTGHWLVYSSTQHRQSADIYMKSIQGTAVTQLTNDPARDEMPAFSPDGKRVAFASNRSGNWDIFVTDIAGGQPMQLTFDPADEIHPSFSSDGKQMVFCAFSERSGQWEMVVIDLDNPSRKNFIGLGLFPQWSPGGDQILFQRAREWGTRWFSLWTLDLINGEARRFTEIVACANAAAITPTWSPDGEHIVFSTVVNPGSEFHDEAPVQADVWIVAADGADRINLTNSSFANLQPTWSRDGTILFVSNRAHGGMENVWSIRPDVALQLARDSTMNVTEVSLPQQPAPRLHKAVPVPMETGQVMSATPAAPTGPTSGNSGLVVSPTVP